MPKHAEKPGRDALLLDVERGTADDQIGAAAHSGHRRGIEGRHVIARGLPHGAVHGDLARLSLGGSGRELDVREPVGIGVRQRAHEDRVGEAEDRRAGADHERERDDGGGGERRRAAHDAKRITDVAPERVEDGDPGHRLHLLELRARIAEGQPRLALGLVARPAARHQLLHMERQVGLHLVGALPSSRAWQEEPPQAHDWAGRITRATARTSVSHREASARSLARPARVSR